MEYADVKEFMDYICKIHQEASATHEFANHVKVTLNATLVLTYEGIEFLADAMGLELKEEAVDVESPFKYRHSFIYKDVEFVSYSNKSMEV